MNLKKSLVSAVAGLALLGSIAAPMASAQPAESDSSNNTAPAYVSVTQGGAFDVYVYSSSLDFGTINFDAQSNQPVTRNGNIVVGYVDTMVNRPNFDVTLQASNFDSGTAWFASDGLKVTTTYNVAQGQWGASPDIGDIGAFRNEQYVAQNSGPWTWTSNQELNSARKVQFGYAGIGTIWSTGQIDLSLTIPPTVSPGTYTSQLTLSVVAGTQP